MKLDMHCHTKEGSLDGKIPIEDYIVSLIEKGFDGMLVTDHNSYKGYRHWKKNIKGKKYTDFYVFKGVEYDTIDAGHILVIMPDTIKLRILELRGLPVRILIELVHRMGGILGPAHPCGEKYLSYTNAKRHRKNQELLAQFDFMEAFNACEPAESNEQAAGLVRELSLVGIGGSDAHREDCIGLGFTKLEEYVTNERELIAYIKAKKPVTCGGTLYTGTTKEKLGAANLFLVKSFWLYNKFGGMMKMRKRKKAMKKDPHIIKKE